MQHAIQEGNTPNHSLSVFTNTDCTECYEVVGAKEFKTESQNLTNKLNQTV